MNRKSLRYLVFFLILFLAACTLPATVSTPQVVDNPAYTAAAETINAQLTGIALPTQTPVPQQPEDTSQPGGETSGPTPTETLPNTSTPEPTRTSLPSETPIPSATPEPTETPQPTVASEDPKASLGDPDWTDTFANAANWPIYTDEHVEMWLQNGSLMMSALNNDKYEAWMITSALIDDVYLEASVTTGDCSGLDRYGLLVRAPDATQGYLFGFTCDGRYAIRIWDGQGFVMLTEWKSSEHILKGADQTNLIGVKATGDQFSLYANGKLVAEVTDSTYTSGSFGLFVGSFLTPGFTIEISEISYWILP
ncbi:MAG TPA: hypothetical protein VLM80_08580 [Anaerolineales bacterium]|nr:hypothetical protein [Anaerolineales bacterium]